MRETMFLHFGHRNYGKVDVVPDLCYVATRFFHVNFVPLIPLESSIILAGTEKADNIQGIKTSLSLKSILVAWFRAGLYFGMATILVFGLVLAIDCLQPRHASDWLAVLGVLGVAGLVGIILWLTYRFNRAGFDRAMQLGAELGLEPEHIEKFLTKPTEVRTEPAREPEGWERYR
jgi:hypothetical protein